MYKPIKNHEDYFINENGIIIDNNQNVIRTSQDLNGYLYAHLDNEKVLIHEAVANTFLGESDLSHVIHKDSDILHNHISNLKFSEKAEKTTAYLDRKRYGKNHLSNNPSGTNIPYMVYNDETGDAIICENRAKVAELIQYELISLKNMVGNDRKISIGPYAGYKITRMTRSK